MIIFQERMLKGKANVTLIPNSIESETKLPTNHNPGTRICAQGTHNRSLTSIHEAVRYGIPMRWDIIIFGSSYILPARYTY
jgi:hypothetical protein